MTTVSGIDVHISLSMYAFDCYAKTLHRYVLSSSVTRCHIVSIFFIFTGEGGSRAAITEIRSLRPTINYISGKE